MLTAFADLSQASLPSPPKLLAPEVVHVAFNDLQNYAATMNPNPFYPPPRSRRPTRWARTSC
jgi:hypothetical protein